METNENTKTAKNIRYAVTRIYPDRDTVSIVHRDAQTIMHLAEFPGMEYAKLIEPTNEPAEQILMDDEKAL